MGSLKAGHSKIRKEKMQGCRVKGFDGEKGAFDKVRIYTLILL
jgi:hypothetical protein